MKYRVGQLAKMMGISTVGLRHYEKFGLIEPERAEQNNYRSYHAVDLSVVNRARSYMAYGFTLQEASALMLERDVEGLAEDMQAKLPELEKQLAYDYHRLLFLRRHSQHLAQIAANENTCLIEKRPAMYGFSYRRGSQLLQDKERSRLVKEWNELRPFTQALFLMPGQTFGRECNQYEIGFCIDAEFADFLGIEAGKTVTYYPACCAVHAITCCEYEAEGEDEPIDFNFLFDWLEKRQLSIRGDAVGRIVHTTRASGQWVHHLEIWAELA